MTRATVLYLVVFAGLFLGAIIVGVLLTRIFAKAPTINLVQGKLNDDEGDDLKEAVKYLKITNNKFASLAEPTQEVVKRDFKK